MYLIALLKVLYANGITIREGIDYDSTGEVTDVIFLGEQADVPEELMSLPSWERGLKL